MYMYDAVAGSLLHYIKKVKGLLSCKHNITVCL